MQRALLDVGNTTILPAFKISPQFEQYVAQEPILFAAPLSLRPRKLHAVVPEPELADVGNVLTRAKVLVERMRVELARAPAAIAIVPRPPNSSSCSNEASIGSLDLSHSSAPKAQQHREREQSPLPGSAVSEVADEGSSSSGKAPG